MNTKLMTEGNIEADAGRSPSKEIDQITLFDVAKFIYDKWHRTYITQIELHKLLWFCQGWYYYATNKILFEEGFEAWQNGPVSPKLWNYFKGTVSLYKEDFDNLPVGDSRKLKRKKVVMKVVKKVLRVYGQFSQAELIYLTHQCDPWKNHVDSDLQIIPKDEIMKYFQKV